MQIVTLSPFSLAISLSTPGYISKSFKRSDFTFLVKVVASCLGEWLVDASHPVLQFLKLRN